MSHNPDPTADTSTVRELMRLTDMMTQDEMSHEIVEQGLEVTRCHKIIETLTARNAVLEAALKEAKSELRDMWHDHPVMVKIDAALEESHD